MPRCGSALAHVHRVLQLPCQHGLLRSWSLATRYSPNIPWTTYCVANFTTPSSRSQGLGAFPHIDDTIYALSTAPGRAGIAVIRLSGPACVEVYQSLCPGKAPLRPRRAAVRTLFRPGADRPLVLDSHALLLYFPGPRSVTGENVLELHVHGGPATVKAVLAALPACARTLPVRYAEPGEFTKRAFLHGRMDLAQVEALSDTLSAETEQQRRAAVQGNSGALGRTYEQWRQQLLAARGELEALIDFSEDQHFDESPEQFLSSISKQVETILASIKKHDQAGRCGELLKRGIRISLLGPPNVGKSSLLNRVVGREAAIVSAEAGTTRDVLEVNLDIGGYLCTFADTAGLRGHASSTEPVLGQVEQEGIRRAKAQALESNIVVVLAAVEVDQSGNPLLLFDPSSLELASGAECSLIVVNKSDLLPSHELDRLIRDFRSKHLGASHEKTAVVAISCKHAQDATLTSNLDGLVAALTTLMSTLTAVPHGMHDLLGVTERQRQLLAACAEHLSDYQAEAKTGQVGERDEHGRPSSSIHAEDSVECDIVIAAEHLRSAATCLARITGRGEGGDVEEVLGVVFEKFCVGK